MKLFEFYKNLHEAPAPAPALPADVCKDWEKTIKGMVELPPLGVVDGKSFCANCTIKNFYVGAMVPAAQPYCDCCPKTSKPEDPKPADGS